MTDLRSSPPTFKGSEMQNLRDYMAWLIATGHTSREFGEAARDAFVREGWRFQ